MYFGAVCVVSRIYSDTPFDSFSLQSVLRVLENPNSWDAFRRAGGFTGLLSLVTDMEGALCHPPQTEAWKTLGHRSLLDLLLLTIHILTLAVHVHAVNAHHFESGGFYERLAEALLQLGCFHTGAPENCLPTSEDSRSPGRSFQQFVELAKSTKDACAAPQISLPVPLWTCVLLLSSLDQFTTGTYSPLDLNVEMEPRNGCGGDGEEMKLRSGSPPADDTQGRSRNAAHSVSTVCSESQYRWRNFHPLATNMNVFYRVANRLDF